ncbi:MAG TPA: hypothetical protein VFP91_06335 [Vicinamibacterales bacterium]|nr:hypothetical protein [Vicinamibacterales bacterium]
MRISRLLISFSVAAAAAIFFASVALYAQASREPARNDVSKGWSVPRTPWGDPDLQGLWPSIDMQGTPYERPENFGTRAVLSEQELTARETQTARQAEADAETTINTQRAPRGTGTGPPSHWGERGRPSRQASLIVDPVDGRFPPMTAEGEKRSREAYSTYFLDFPDAVTAHPFNEFSDLGVYDRCITRGLLASILPTAYNMGNQIIQVPGAVIVRNEMIHETRVIPLDSRPHVGSKIRQYLGDSRGHWDGTTLVVETTNFNGKVGITRNGNTLPTSQDLKIVERFERVAPDTMQYTATVTDPKTWTRPWTVSLPLKLHPEYQFFEYACHEGNYAMKHILSGARADERASGDKVAQ